MLGRSPSTVYREIKRGITLDVTYFAESTQRIIVQRKLNTKDLINPQEVIDTVLIKSIFKQKKKKYGIRRIKMELEKLGKVMNRKKIARIMKEENLQTKIRRKNHIKTK